MKKTIIVLLLILFLPGISLAVATQGNGNLPMGMHHGGFQRLTKALNLSPEQAQKLKDMRESFFAQNAPLWNDLRSKRLELRALWLQTNPDEGKILAKQKEINALRADIQERVTRDRFEMRKVLTPEQQSKLTFLLARSRHWR